MSSPTYWSQPNQQVVRDGDPVGVLDDGPDPQAKSKETKAKPEADEPETKPAPKVEHKPETKAEPKK